MSKSKKQDVSPPRPEAAPLPFKRLTRAQRKAGEAIASALHRMASERGPSGVASTQEHLYLPHLENRRSNRVLLIDGSRGTGKSTLMVTLLNGYGLQVLGQKLPEKFEEMDDRIIPIGIVDLQPLPPQTNLPLHIAGHLKRVVEAVEPHPPVTTEGSPPIWDGQRLSHLREKWQGLMKLLATWDESLEARLGRPDLSAYVVETIEEELERGQLPERFREALDALVEGYAGRFRWSSGKKPFFLLAIDDADMNPRLSVKLLELLRKLWHPRLAFLVAGDSNLFLSRLQESLYAQGNKAPIDQEHYRRLAEDIYAKDIPSSARFRLDSLTHTERVKRISEIRKLLKQYTIEVHSPELPREYPERSPTLRDYLLVNKQSAELFPERLRQIDELTAKLRRGIATEETAAPSAEAFWVIKILWDQTVQEHIREAKQQRELTEWVRTSRLDGRLRLNTQKVRLGGEFEPVVKIPEKGNASTITLQDLSHFHTPAAQERFLSPPNGTWTLNGPLTACWLLATDVAADAVHGSHSGEASFPFEEDSLQFVVASWQGPNSQATLSVPWLLPFWKAPVDYVLFAKHWRELLDSGEPRQKEDVGLIARQFLWLAIQIARNRTVPDSKTAWWTNVPDWPLLTEALAELAKQPETNSPRQQLNVRWAMEEAVLMAAPESCLPLEEARNFFDAWMKVFGPLRSPSEIQERRLSRMKSSALSASDREGALDDIAASNPKHPFVQALKVFEEKSSHSHRSNSPDLWNRLYDLKVPHLESLMGEKKFSHYITDFRQRALGSLSKSIASAALLEVERSWQISENTRTSVILVRLWQLFSEKLARPDIMDWFSLNQTRIIINKAASDFGGNLRELLLSGRDGEAQTIQIDQARNLHIERFPVTRHASEIPAPMDALFRLIFDYVQDQDDAIAIQDEHLGLWLWPAIFTGLPSGSKHLIHPWPAVRWPSLKEFEDFVRTWSDANRNLNEWLNLDKAIHKPYAADALAFIYLKNHEYSRHRSGGSGYLENDAIEAKFADLLKKINNKPNMQAGRRDRLFSKWIESLPLMGTPEAALSDSIAQLFIEQAFSAGMTRDQLRQLRRERTRADGVPEDQIATLLEQIDQPFPEHPWVKQVEAHDLADGDGPPRK